MYAPMEIRVARAGELDGGERNRIVELCNKAYEEPFDELFTFLPGHALHFIGLISGRPVTHAVVTERRFLVDRKTRLKAAYVDAVAAHPDHQKKGFAGALMKRLVSEVSQGFDIAGLSTFIPAWYSRLGWEAWQGEIALRVDGVLDSTPHGKGVVMVHRLLATPELSLKEHLSAEWRPGGGW